MGKKERKYIQIEGKVNRSNKIKAVSYKACKGTLILDTISRIFWERKMGKILFSIKTSELVATLEKII